MTQHAPHESHIRRVPVLGAPLPSTLIFFRGNDRSYCHGSREAGVNTSRPNVFPLESILRAALSSLSYGVGGGVKKLCRCKSSATVAKGEKWLELKRAAMRELELLATHPLTVAGQTAPGRRTSANQNSELWPEASQDSHSLSVIISEILKWLWASRPGRQAVDPGHFRVFMTHGEQLRASAL
ncbi:hypothetical protein EYF80_005791 [Liparis tanakae]|uniref:Uncharacterized protein n=1 Tax=Liparis tanakae TaxID=230148 RepID=A0A4Z2J0X1_9TELE|nr:hypothetical protein EYF80_005791 [Liparis tanakae]